MADPTTDPITPDPDAPEAPTAAPAEVKMLPRAVASLLPDVQVRFAQVVHTIDLDRADALEKICTELGCLPLLVEEINALRDPDRYAHRLQQASRSF
jgi:hypothetical protein